MTDLAGAYRFPTHIAVAHDVFGATFEFVIGTQRGDLVVPAVQWQETAEKFDVVAPALGGLSDRYRSLVDDDGWHAWGQVSEWHRGGTFPGGHLKQVVLRFTAITDEVERADPSLRGDTPKGHAIDSLLSNVDGWFDRVRMWVSAVSEQDTSIDAPLPSSSMQGRGLSVWVVANKNRYERPAQQNKVSIHSNQTRYIPKPVFATILALANHGQSPSPTHHLLGSAREGLRRGYPRRAVLDAATACELSLTKLFEELLSPLSATVAETLFRQTRGLKQLVDVVACEYALPPVVRCVAEPRNRAIHKNQDPSAEEARNAIVTAREVAHIADPLPGELGRWADSFRGNDGRS